MRYVEVHPSLASLLQPSCCKGVIFVMFTRRDGNVSEGKLHREREAGDGNCGGGPSRTLHAATTDRVAAV